MLIAIEEHWITPAVTSALKAQARPDESLAFNEMGDHRQRLEDLGERRIAAMDAQGIDLSILALTPPGTQPLSPEQARRLSSAANDTAIAAVSKHSTRFRGVRGIRAFRPDWSAAHVGGVVHGIRDSPLHRVTSDQLDRPPFHRRVRRKFRGNLAALSARCGILRASALVGWVRFV